MSVHPCFHLWTITWRNISGFSPNLACALILWTSGLGLLMGRFCQFLTVIYPPHDSGRVLLFYVFYLFWISHDYDLHICCHPWIEERLTLAVGLDEDLPFHWVYYGRVFYVLLDYKASHNNNRWWKNKKRHQKVRHCIKCESSAYIVDNSHQMISLIFLEKLKKKKK